MEIKHIRDLIAGHPVEQQVINEFLYIIEKCGYTYLHDDKIYGMFTSPIEGQLVYEITPYEHRTLLQEYNLADTGYYKGFIVSEPFSTFVRKANGVYNPNIEIIPDAKHLTKMINYLTREILIKKRAIEHATKTVEHFEYLIKHADDDKFYTDTIIQGCDYGRWEDDVTTTFSIVKISDTETLLKWREDYEEQEELLVTYPFDHFLGLAFENEYPSQEEYDRKEYDGCLESVKYYKFCIMDKYHKIQSYLDKYPHWRQE